MNGAPGRGNGKGEMRGFFPFGKLRVRMTISGSSLVGCGDETNWLGIDGTGVAVLAYERVSKSYPQDDPPYVARLP
jgi:hypothetical protein